VVVVLYVAENLDKFFSIAGCIFGMSNVLLLPSLCHLKLVAETRRQRVFDYGIITFAIFMLFFGPATIMMQWYNNKEEAITLAE